MYEFLREVDGDDEHEKVDIDDDNIAHSALHTEIDFLPTVQTVLAETNLNSSEESCSLLKTSISFSTHQPFNLYLHHISPYQGWQRKTTKTHRPL